MNWIKGLDRIILSTSFIVFIVVSCFIYPVTENIARLSDINPEYEKWINVHGKEQYEEFWENIDFESNAPIPPKKYLPVKIHRRIIVTGIVSLVSFGIWIIGLSGVTRLIKITAKWIIKGFREQVKHL